VAYGVLAATALGLSPEQIERHVIALCRTRRPRRYRLTRKHAPGRGIVELPAGRTESPDVVAPAATPSAGNSDLRFAILCLAHIRGRNT
jgi:hypothetical protein